MKSIVKQFLLYRYHRPRRLFSTNIVTDVRTFQQLQQPLIIQRRFNSSAIKVSAKDVKTLREQTGAPMMECKKALSHEDVQGDIEKAIDWLRKNGIAAASKRSSKDAAEGLLRLSQSDFSGEINLGRGKTRSIKSVLDSIEEVFGKFKYSVNHSSNDYLENSASDNSLLKATLNWTPNYNFKKSLICLFI